MNERKDGFLVVKTSGFRVAIAQVQGKRLPPKEIVKLAVIPCVWKLFHKSRGGQAGPSLDPLLFEWVPPEKIKDCDFEYFVKSQSIASDYLAYEENALVNWEMFRGAYLEAFPDANEAELTELEKPETETKKKRVRTVLDEKKKGEIVKFAEKHPDMYFTELEKYFRLGRGTISQNKALAGAIRKVRNDCVYGGSICKSDGTRYTDR